MTPEDSKKSVTERQSAEKKTPESGLSETVSVPHSTSADAPAPGSAAGAEAWVGKTLGKYQVTSVLGRGAMGVVLRAHDPLIERDIAIKVLGDNLAADATALARFVAEAKSAGKINHANVVAIYEVCQQQAMTYLVLEYVAGGSLEDRLTERRVLSVLEATKALIDACKGVGAAHAAGLIHRDIKPANFMRAVDGSIKVADFGLAKSVNRSSHGFTQMGMVVGTPFYMSPEQCEAKPLDPRSDIYSLGATYYHLLTGKSPYHDSDGVSQLMYAHCHGPIPDPRSLDQTIPEACARIIARAMAKGPVDRYQSTADMCADLHAVLAALSGPTRIDLPSDSATVAARSATRASAAASQQIVFSSRRWLLVLAAGVVIAGVALAAWLAWGGKGQLSDSKAVATAPAAPADTHALTATAPGVTATEITLGMSAPFSGPAKELGRDMQTGIDTYLSHINETRGGIHGRKVKLLALDDGYDPKRCAETMNDMIRKRPVFAFIGNVGTPTAEVSVPMILEHKRALFGAFTGAGLLRRDPPDRYVFNYRPSYAEETAAIVKYLLTVRKVLPEQMAVFAQQDGYGDAGFNGVAKALRKGGFDTDRILRVGYQRNAIDIEEAARTLLKHKDRIKAVVMVPTYAPAAAFIKRLRDAGMNPIFTSVSFVGSGALAEELKNIAPQFAKSIIITQVVPFPWS